jgi:uncharacterized protein YejL (UPF0352 family)
MTTEMEKIQATPLSTVDEWLESLTDEQVALLRRHKDSQDLPLLVMALVKTGPLSPMQISDASGHTTAAMPPAISQALG